MITSAQLRQRKLFRAKGSLSMAKSHLNFVDSELLSREYRYRIAAVIKRIEMLQKDFNKEVGWKEDK